MERVELDITSSPETEKALLGCLMVFPEMIDQVAPLLGAEDFYSSVSKEVYGAILNLRGNKEITYLSIGHELGARLQPIGGIYELSGYLDYAAFRFEAREYARVIKGKARARSILDTANYAARELTAGASMEEIGHILQDLSSAGEQESSTIGSYVEDAIEAFRQSVDAHGRSKGISTGFYDIDKYMGGFERGELTVLAGRPAQGKTALAASLSRKALDSGRKIMFASLEMTARTLIQRMAYGMARVDGQKYNMGEFNPDEIRKLNFACEQIRTMPLEIDEKSGQSVDEIYARAKQIQPDMVIIDYLQLLAAPSKGMSLYERVTENSLACKSMAKNLGIPVLLLSQLSRETERRGKSKRPIMSDLRESGAIEQDADHIWLLYRPEVYDIVQLKDGTNTENLAEVIIAKNRNGPTGSVRMTFLKKFVSFEGYFKEPL